MIDDAVKQTVKTKGIEYVGTFLDGAVTALGWAFVAIALTPLLHHIWKRLEKRV